MADYELVGFLIRAVRENNVRYYVVITASSDKFYLNMSSMTRLPDMSQKISGLLKELQGLRVLNYEMESSTVLTLCSSTGLIGGCISGVVLNRTV